MTRKKSEMTPDELLADASDTREWIYATAIAELNRRTVNKMMYASLATAFFGFCLVVVAVIELVKTWPA